MEVTLSPIPVLFVFSENGTAGASAAFDKLEAKLPNLKKRRFYGALEGSAETAVYRACVGIVDGDKPSEMNLKTWTIPGGKYAREKINNWHQNLKNIEATINKMSKQYTVDPTRPTIEFYRSEIELFLLLPIK